MNKTFCDTKGCGKEIKMQDTAMISGKATLEIDQNRRFLISAQKKSNNDSVSGMIDARSDLCRECLIKELMKSVETK